ncbi:MAG TPA: UDP-N-acetylmuramoyl-tripeptide--D-alanyl-D-alanine ligase [Candidatus Marinimicrobia bacterium]|nr:UDP-N-acetylmuramoyl-tripeptide--D-alanyl-D-alanine ligase [Candidatus Neomarinimicrobiota bacterium]MDP7217305.1 UDP-N-acetylmuramoyl-tripeptide--D-alanyl-D-alanine ligase [Candidatus Neomarinimicrobiota bacterium]MDP7437010.1 UDP-N-acetylmuramoyl-tripeptide--D-alanyl-D-alanine ligase [Candidatus Neomarinimicrobiota bacterium]HJL74048.1 UDP-N-acetylmuramoyl-tripeptide--D-alanyl-D-alanine ligase [Candidatus Neomarinimicrobiota bacterium]HJM69921.1 UDP-N-acetylmuramoyl-tripeptide--D-alanyl-D-
MRITLPEPEAFSTLITQYTGKEPTAPITGIATDSRECITGDLYIALKGEHADGHQFIQQAIEKGAVAGLVEHEFTVPQAVDFFIVEDVLESLGRLARDWRRQYDIPVIGITGSNGKTTTKELLKHIFEASENVHATTGNYNTSVGLPLTLLQLTGEHTISIIEMGANQSGDIEYLCNIAEPTHGLITNIAPAHLEGFGSIEEVARTKGALFNTLEHGTAFVNMADEHVRNLDIRGTSITYGLTPDCDFPADIHHEDDGTITITIDAEEIVTASHNLSFVKNVIAASAVANHLRIDWDTFRSKIKSFQSPKGRCEVKQYNDITIIDDTYNANLTSTIAAIDYLKAFSGNGRRVFVFGDMFELGEGSMDHHRKVGEHCKAMELDAVFSTGDESTYTDRVLNDSMFHKHYYTKDELLSSLKNWIQAGDKLLVKGSRGMAMETIIDGLSNN